MIARGGEYWAFGMALSDGKDPSAYTGNLFVHSPDGMSWSREVQAQGFSADCKTAGCLEGEGVIATVYDPVPDYIYFPTGKPLTSEWAVAEGNICLISRDFSCASASKTNEPPPRSNRSSEFITERLDDPLHGCIACPVDSFPIEKGLLKPATFVGEITGPGTRTTLPPVTLLRFHADVDVTYRLQEDGTTKDVQITGTEIKQVEDGVRADVESWLFQPHSPDVGKTEMLRLDVGCGGLPSEEDPQCHAGLPANSSKYPRVN